MRWTFVTCLVHAASELFSTWERLLLLSGMKMICPRKAEDARYTLSLVAPPSHIPMKDFEEITKREVIVNSFSFLQLTLEVLIRSNF